MQTFAAFLSESETRTLYHGTTRDKLASIRENGLKPSADDVLYLTDSWVIAVHYANLRATADNHGVVVALRVPSSLPLDVLPVTRPTVGGKPVPPDAHVYTSRHALKPEWIESTSPAKL